MKLNFDIIKSDIDSLGESLINGDCLYDDMQVLNWYYTELSPEDRPDSLKEYYSLCPEFSIEKFTEAYFKSLCGYELRFTVTHDGWVRLIKLNS